MEEFFTVIEEHSFTAFLIALFIYLCLEVIFKNKK